MPRIYIIFMFISPELQPVGFKFKIKVRVAGFCPLLLCDLLDFKSPRPTDVLQLYVSRRPVIISIDRIKKERKNKKFIGRVVKGSKFLQRGWAASSNTGEKTCKQRMIWIRRLKHIILINSGELDWTCSGVRRPY